MQATKQNYKLNTNKRISNQTDLPSNGQTNWLMFNKLNEQQIMAQTNETNSLRETNKHTNKQTNKQIEEFNGQCIRKTWIQPSNQE